MGLFNRPTSAATTGAASGGDGPTDMFSHSHSFSAIQAEQEQRRRAKPEKRVKQEGKRKSDEGTEESPKRKKKETRESPRKKSDETPKRRISAKDIGNLLKEAGIPGDTEEESENEEIVMEAAREQSRSPVRLARSTATRSSSRTTRQTQPKDEVIEVGGSSGDEAQRISSHNVLPVENEDDESDEELAALARQARQRRLQRTQTATPDVATKSPTPRDAGTESTHTGLQSPPLLDPPVKILVVSQIDNTKPLLVYRKLSQNLREIRIAWCKRQGFGEAKTEEVFLVHRARKVYDVTTCRSLGLETDAEGNITMKGAESKEGVDQVALEAVTQDIYDKMLAEKAREEAKRRGKWDLPTEAGAQEEASTAPVVSQEMIGLVLKAKGKPDFKLKVKPTTTFSKIIHACRKTFHVAEGSTVTLDFDGEQLDPGDQVQSTDMEDLDVVDVHISS